MDVHDPQAAARALAFTAVKNIRLPDILNHLGVTPQHFDSISDTDVIRAVVTDVQAHLARIADGLRPPQQGPAAPDDDVPAPASVPELARLVDWPGSTTVQQLGLSLRVTNVLLRQGIGTLRLLRTTPDDRFQSFPQFGPAGIQELRGALMRAAQSPRPGAASTEDEARRWPESDDMAALARAIDWPGSTAVQQLGLSLRATNSLIRAGITILDDLRTATDDEIREIPQFGPAAVEELQEALARAADLPRSAAPQAEPAASGEPVTPRPPDPVGPPLTTVRARILRALVRNPGRSLYVSEIVALTRVEDSKVRAALKVFADQGWVNSDLEEGSAQDLGRTPRRYYRISPAGQNAYAHRHPAEGRRQLSPFEAGRVGEAFLELVRKGQTQADACAQLDISVATVRRWRMNDKKFAARYEQAREQGRE
ncbi:DNA-directed RNA polymerase subunit alpha C-terminal domain-containing protein, partial [Planobispora siamensis]